MLIYFIYTKYDSNKDIFKLILDLIFQAKYNNYDLTLTAQTAIGNHSLVKHLDDLIAKKITTLFDVLSINGGPFLMVSRLQFEQLFFEGHAFQQLPFGLLVLFIKSKPVDRVFIFLLFAEYLYLTNFDLSQQHIDIYGQDIPLTQCRFLPCRTMESRAPSRRFAQFWHIFLDPYLENIIINVLIKF